jgi:hypothetical protein
MDILTFGFIIVAMFITKDAVMEIAMKVEELKKLKHFRARESDI